MGHELAQITVLLVEGKPKNQSVIVIQPLTDQYAFSVSSRCRNKRQRYFLRAVQQFPQPVARHQSRRQVGGTELRLEDIEAVCSAFHYVSTLTVILKKAPGSLRSRAAYSISVKGVSCSSRMFISQLLQYLNKNPAPGRVSQMPSEFHPKLHPE